MTWEIEVFDEFERGKLADIIDSAIGYVPDDFTARDVDRAVERAIDERCVSYWDKLAAIQHMGMTSEAFNLVYEEFSQMVWEKVAEEVGDERMVW